MCAWGCVCVYAGIGLNGSQGIGLSRGILGWTDGLFKMGWVGLGWVSSYAIYVTDTLIWPLRLSLDVES